MPTPPKKPSTASSTRQSTGSVLVARPMRRADAGEVAAVAGPDQPVPGGEAGRRAAARTRAAACAGRRGAGGRRRRWRGGGSGGGRGGSPAAAPGRRAAGRGPAGVVGAGAGGRGCRGPSGGAAPEVGGLGSFVGHDFDPAARPARGASGGDPDATLRSRRRRCRGRPRGPAAPAPCDDRTGAGDDRAAPCPRESDHRRRDPRHAPPVPARDHRIVAGVAAGMADHLGIPVPAVRVALVVLLGFNGLGLLLYAAFWAVAAAAARPPPSRPARDLGHAAAVRARSGSACMLLQGLVFDSNGVAGTAGWLIAIIAVGAGRDLAPVRPEPPPAVGRPTPQAPWLAAVVAESDRRLVPVPLHRRRGAGRGRHHRRGRRLLARRRTSTRCFNGVIFALVGAGRRRRGGRAAAVAHLRPAARGAGGPHPGAGAGRAGRHGPRPGAAHARADPAQRRRRHSGAAAGPRPGAQPAQLALQADRRRRPSGSPPRWSRPPRRSRTRTRSRWRRSWSATPRPTSGSAALVAAAREALVNAARHAEGADRVALRRGRGRSAERLRPGPRAPASTSATVEDRPARRAGVDHRADAAARRPGRDPQSRRARAPRSG